MITEQGVARRTRPSSGAIRAKPLRWLRFRVEVRPMRIFAALLDLSGENACSRNARPSRRPLEAVTATIQSLLDRAFTEPGSDRARVPGAGMRAAAARSATTGIEGSGSDLLPDWHHMRSGSWFNDALGLPIFVENDANAGAMAEASKAFAQRA